MLDKQEFTKLLKEGRFYVDNSIRDWAGLSSVIRSAKSENLLSIAYRGEYSAIHYVISEFPSILPKDGGKQTVKGELFSFRNISDIEHWMDKYMDSSNPFYPARYKTYYAGLEDGRPDPLVAQG
jgi:hypothetical protein